MIFAMIFISIFTVMSAASVKEKPPVSQERIVSPFGKCEDFTHTRGSNKYQVELKYCGVKK